MSVMDQTRRDGFPPNAQRMAAAERRALAVRAALLGLALLAAALSGAFSAFDVQSAHAQAIGLRAGASCAELATIDRSATNGPAWGRTIFAGHNATGGWFGVDVCDNGVNAVAPNGSNVSCDRTPSDWARTGCAPGMASSDGYGLSFQCVELAIRFSAWAFGASPDQWGRSGWGNAPDLWLPENHPSDFTMYPNGASVAPVAGDIIVWGNVDSAGRPWPAGTDGEHGGHIAVVAAVRGNTLMTAEQNVKWGAQDHPSDTLALTQVNGRWILSGSAEHETRLPTYRWRPTMGTTRATYGWLHATPRQGSAPPTTATPTPHATATPTTTPRQSSGGLPSLAPATLVTRDGTLADLVWTTGDALAPNTPATQPHAQARSLGAPTSVTLATAQRPANVILSDGRRYTYVVGEDGHLYVARTAPHTLGVYWFDHSAPIGVTLRPAIAASLFAGGMGVVALGSDGNLWWREGPAGQLGGWLPLGRPTATTLTTSFTLSGAPGSGAPLVLALGADGALYERSWGDAIYAANGSVETPAGWSDWFVSRAQPSGTRFGGPLLFLAERGPLARLIGDWPDAPLDVLALDGQGQLWLLRLAKGWTVTRVATPKTTNLLLDAAVVAPGATKANAGAPTLRVYTLDATGAAAVASIDPARAPGVTPVSPQWTALGAPPATALASAGAVALALAPEQSALVVRTGATLSAGGLADSLSALAPDAASGAQGAWVSLGATASAAPFDDAFSAAALDPRWTLRGADALASETTSGLRLAPGAAGAAALLQRARSDDASVSVAVTRPLASATAAQAGLALYLDGADAMTLLADGAGKTSFCVTVWGAAPQCQTHILAPPSAAQGATWTLKLRLTRAGSAFRAEASGDDGTTWTPLGQWTLINSAASSAAQPTPPQSTPPPTATAHVTATPSGGASGPDAPRVGSLAFSACGVYVAGADAAGTNASPLFTAFHTASAAGA